MYLLLPKRRQLILASPPPSQKIKKILMKSSLRYCFPWPKMDSERLRNKQMSRGPHRSQFWNSPRPCWRSGSTQRVWRSFPPIDDSWRIFVTNRLLLFVKVTRRRGLRCFYMTFEINIQTYNLLIQSYNTMLIFDFIHLWGRVRLKDFESKETKYINCF